MNNMIQGAQTRNDQVADELFGFEARQTIRGRSDPHAAFDALKRVFDIAVALAAMPFVLLICLLLLLINPIWNRGPLFYMQKRMGRGCRDFTAIKFRTMRPVERITRGPDDPLEDERVTRLGRFLRRKRVDELPQFINVLNGDMSLVGPRPDYWDHAVHYLHSIPGYRDRHNVRPGITGLAQVRSGYAEGVSATVGKTKLDLRYIQSRGLRTEAYILWRTFCVLLTGSGAR